MGRGGGGGGGEFGVLSKFCDIYIYIYIYIYKLPQRSIRACWRPLPRVIRAYLSKCSGSAAG